MAIHNEKPTVKEFFDTATSTLTYVVYDADSKDAIIIDPVLDFDPAAIKTSRQSIEKVDAFIKGAGLTVRMVLETHAHADHLSGGHDLVTSYYPGVPLAIGRRITRVQETFKKVFNLPADFKTDGSQFGRLLDDGEVVEIGTLSFKVLYTPGHTPACASYLFGDALFTGDSLFMPDYGTGRCDFPDGDAKALFHAVKDRIYSLPDATRIYVGHDYQPGGRPLAFQTTVGESKAKNVHIRSTTTEDEFVSFRTKRDATLAVPRLLFASVQVNIAAGAPSPESNGKVYLKAPLTSAKEYGS